MNDHVLIGLSGGADSVCLLHVLLQLQKEFSLSISCAHLNHCLRGEESVRDEQFVKALCGQLNVPLYTKNVNITVLAKEQKISLEEAGRNARYAFFQELNAKYHYNKIATAHNKNDNAETICMRFLRGTSLAGLSGIPICNEHNVIRPLLNSSRNEIEQYLNQNNILYVTDSSNLSDQYTRNQIRHHLLPNIIKNYNASFINTISENSALYREANNYLQAQIELAYEKLVQTHFFGYAIHLQDLLKEDIFIVKSIIHITVKKLTNETLSAKNIRTLTENVLFGSAESMNICIGCTLYKKYNTLYFVKDINVSNFQISCSVPETVEIPQLSKVISFSFCKAVSLNTESACLLDAKMCKGKKLTIRFRKPGDRIFCGNGHNSVKKLMIDKKIPVFLRDKIPILLLDQEIIWVCGVKADPKYLAKENEQAIKVTYI